MDNKSDTSVNKISDELIEDVREKLTGEARKYIGINFLDLDLLHLSEFKEDFKIGTIHTEMGLKGVTKLFLKEEDDDMKYLFSVNIKEFIFGYIATLTRLNEYSNEIDYLFNKRLYSLSDSLIKEQINYYRYLQIGEDVSSTIKLALCILHDIETSIIEEIDIEKLLYLQLNLVVNGEFDIKPFINICNKDIISLLKKINKKYSKSMKTEPVPYLISRTLLDLVSKGKFKVEEECINLVFLFKEYSALDLLGGIKEDDGNVKNTIKKYFNSGNFDKVDGIEGMIKYFKSSINYSRRVVKKGDLERIGMNEDTSLAGMSIMPYAPVGQNRSDYQFVMYIMINHLYSSINKDLRKYTDSAGREEFEKRLYTSFKIAERFGFEGKELYNTATSIYMMKHTINDIDDIVKIYVENIISNILHLKNFEDSKVLAMNQMFKEINQLQNENDKSKENEEQFKINLEKRLNKEIYNKVKDEFNEEVRALKKKVKDLEKQLDNDLDKKEDSEEILVTSDKSKETINLSTKTAVFVGDSNFDETLLKSVFKEVLKIDGHYVNKVSDPYIVMNKYDVLIYQYEHMKHVSKEYVNAATKYSKKIIYIETSNANLVLSEIYRSYYAD